MRTGKDLAYEVGGMFFQEGELDTYERYYNAMIRPVVLRRRRRKLLLDDVSPAIIYAIVNHGRWMVACPWCRGAEPVYFDRLQFMCLSCFNDEIGGKFAVVRLPREWRAIETVLARRPKANQNYDIGESLTMLKAENARRGIS